MNKKQIDTRLNARRADFRYCLIIASLILLVGAPFDYFVRDSKFALYGGIVLLVASFVIFAAAEVRDLIQRQATEDQA